jgi:hypothetical protein
MLTQMSVIVDNQRSMINGRSSLIDFRTKTFRECYDGGKFSFVMMSMAAKKVFDGFIPVFSEMPICYRWHCLGNDHPPPDHNAKKLVYRHHHQFHSG